MTIVRYRRFRDYLQQRTTTNDTMMGLLAGSKLASQTLLLTRGSELLLSDIFPSVPHIKRFNLTTARAQGVLDDAEDLLGILAVPQVLALQEDLMTGMLELLEQNVPALAPLSNDAKASNVHERFQKATATKFTPESLELFHLVRKARNTHIHNGGRADKTLSNAVASTKPAALQAWSHITGSSFPAYKPNDRVQMGLSELIGILALTKRLADEANEKLQEFLPRDKWADLVIADWLIDRKPGNPEQQAKRLRGLANMEYGAVQLTDDELADARARAGI